MLASDSGVARGKPEIARYDPSRQGAAGAALLAAPKAYNPDADVTANAGKEQKKAKKKKVCTPSCADRLQSLAICLLRALLRCVGRCHVDFLFGYTAYIWPSQPTGPCVSCTCLL